LWKTNEVRWNRNGQYLEAMDGFQRALEPVTKLWKKRSKETNTTTRTKQENFDKINGDEGQLPLSTLSLKGSNEDDETEDSRETTTKLGIGLARKLLFCAYCEADGNQIQSCRTRLAQCVSILLECSQLASVSNNPQKNKMRQILTPLLNDAWMELMLSYEEEKSPGFRTIARHVVHLAIQSSRDNTLYNCDWKDPLQRPGYMAPLEITSAPTDVHHHHQLAPPYVRPEEHPSWCRILESHWKDIFGELATLTQSSTATTAVSRRDCSTTNQWTVVGSGDRGSGGDDHRVVAPGGKWTEYVLFGTGSHQADAPITKNLLRKLVPDAVSLAEAGGGEVIFSRLAPNTRIEAHCGPTNFRWTAHLGLLIPQEKHNCSIRVADEWHHWEAGKILLFDDSYEHEIRNDTDEVRIVLLLRLWHPGLSPNKRQTAMREAVRRKEASVEKRYRAPQV
jgi:hypothetical protein